MTNPYRKDVRHLDELDLYVLADLYDVKSHAVFHAIKKLICAGKRGAKGYEQDLMEAIESIERELQLMPVAEAREVGAVQECGFKPMHHEGIMPTEDVEPDWDRRHPSLRFAVKDEQGKFVFCKDQPSSGIFWIRPADFDEQRIDAIGQNGNDGEHYGCQWIEWNGGDAPVVPLCLVDVKLRNGNKHMAEKANALRWDHIGCNGVDDDIVAYRLSI